jgi:hypothetical protein
MGDFARIVRGDLTSFKGGLADGEGGTGKGAGGGADRACGGAASSLSTVFESAISSSEPCSALKYCSTRALLEASKASGYFFSYKIKYIRY